MILLSSGGRGAGTMIHSGGGSVKCSGVLISQFICLFVVLSIQAANARERRRMNRMNEAFLR